MNEILSQDFSRLQEQLLHCDVIGKSAFDHQLYVRWQDAYLVTQQKASLFAGPSLDLATLTRQILRRESERTGRTRELSIPREGPGTPWPSEAQWKLCSVSVVERTSTYLRITADPWIREEFGDADPTREATAEFTRREQAFDPADPAFERMTGFTNYTTPGQRQALRAIWYAPPGATITAILPTGSGKSLVAQLPALEQARRGRLSILVVPTVVLAMDQENSLRSLAGRDEFYDVTLGQRLAYHGGLTKVERQDFRERILKGQQGVLITAPEHLLGNLAGPLHEIAERGELALLAIDEAHLASQWGASFRPDFQTLAGLRRALLSSSPAESRFITLLMTATLAERDLQTVEDLFASPGPYELIAAVKLRPEPSYHHVAFEGADRRARFLLETVLHAPKPLIVYVTTRADAELQFRRLKGAGLQRVGVMHGDSTSRQRESVLADWQKGRLDVVVGTAAFGVGVDKRDVRTVVHACVPESADRYYQEVGRSGRDGSASCAIALTTPMDWDIAHGLAQAKLISVERGLERWVRLFGAASQPTLGLFRVDTRLQPANLHMPTLEGHAWNYRTLNLMALAGLIQLEHAPPPRKSISTSDAEFDQDMDTYRHAVSVRILDNTHLARATWEARVDPVRAELYAQGARSLKLLGELLAGDRPAEDVLCEVYRVDGSRQIFPKPACGGCKPCRRARLEPYPGMDPTPTVSLWRHVEPEGPLLAILQGERIASLEARDPEELDWALRRLVEGGVRLLIDPEGTLSYSQLLSLQSAAQGPLLVERTVETFGLPSLPTAFIVPTLWSTLRATWTIPRADPTVLVVQDDTVIQTDGGLPLIQAVPRVVRVSSLRG